MDRYSVKQPQNIIEVKTKQHGIGKKNPGKKLDEIYIIAFVLCRGQLVLELYLNQKQLFS